MVGRLLIISGASGVGKSTLTARITAALEFDKVVSSDTIRETLRTTVSVEESPALHRSSFQPSGSGAIADWKATIAPLRDAIDAVIAREMKRGGDLLLEGVHFAPSFGLIDSWRAAGGTACGVVMAVEDAEEHVRMIAGRRKHNGRPVRHYLDHIERIREIQAEMLRLAEKSGWLTLDITQADDPIGHIDSVLHG
jgi:2-phosphoglycerate kinase